jgi:hypothetical protein
MQSLREMLNYIKSNIPGYRIAIQRDCGPDAELLLTGHSTQISTSFDSAPRFVSRVQTETDER